MINAEHSVKYLQLIRPSGMMNLVAIHPISNDIKGITRRSTSKELYNFIINHIDNYNLYYTANEPYVDAPDQKLNKSHIEFIHALYIDKDPAKDPNADFSTQRRDLLNFAKDLNEEIFKPSYIIDSGNGIQALWLLQNKLEATEDNTILFEELGRGLSLKYHSDAIQNIDRILRLPFTKNIPTIKKQNLGRIPAVSKVLYYSQETYD